MAWYYKDGDEDVGPIDKAQLQTLYKTQKINVDTPVRNGEQTEWRPLKEWVGKKQKAAVAPPKRPPAEAAAEPPRPSPPPARRPLQTPPPQGMD